MMKAMEQAGEAGKRMGDVSRGSGQTPSRGADWFLSPANEHRAQQTRRPTRVTLGHLTICSQIKLHV